MASKHYVGKSHVLLRTAVDEAFAPYGAILVPTGTKTSAPLRALQGTNATG
jgi:hypothetical protein